MNNTPDINLWARVHAMCVALNPAQPNGGLLPAATDAQIAEAERIVGNAFPEDLKDAYLHFNGMMTRGHFALFPGHFKWMPLAEESEANWMYLKTCRGDDPWQTDPDLMEIQKEDDRSVIEAGEPVYRKFADCTRIPVAFDPTVVTLFVDTQPPPGGCPGQVIVSDPEDPGSTRVVANSFSEAAEKLVSAYEAGRVVYDHERANTWVSAETGRLVDLVDL